MNLFSKKPAMNAERFQEHWAELVETPLLESGFQASGKSLFIEKNDCALALIRLGGKFSRPGSVCHTFCFRHLFLRNLKEENSKKFEKEIFAYPVKFEPSKISSLGKKGWLYTSTNLRYPNERVDFSKRKENLVITDLNRLRQDILDASEHLPKILIPDVMEFQIRQNGEAAWIERIWLEDYENRKAQPVEIADT